MFEEHTVRLVKEGKIHGTAHFCVGEEATGVGVCAALEKGDFFTQTHRGRSQAFGADFDMAAMFAELLGKPSGTCKGRGGSMHIADFSKGSLGANGIVGGSIPIACGSALTQQMGRKPNITVCFFGDGAMNEGTFHESLNLAALWRLPVLFVCTNNLYGMSTHIGRSTAVDDLSRRGESAGIPGVTIDGNDVTAVYEATRAAREAVLNDGPGLLVLNTYRWYGHSKSDPQVYRDQEEVAAWKERCPLKTLRERCISAQTHSPGDFERLDEQAGQEVKSALAAALAAPEAKIRDSVCLLDEVYA
jgi:pyruvate dehydrogenase E1 component alpha subunit